MFLIPSSLGIGWYSRLQSWKDDIVINSVETTWQWEQKLVTIPWYTEIYFERAYTDVKDKTIFGSTVLLFAERSNTQHARVKAKTVIIKAVQGTCLRTNWCEVLLLHKS